MRQEKRRWGIRSIGIIIGVVMLLCVIPSLVLMIFLHQHVDYRGEETPKYALQGIYSAEEFDLKETIHTMKTSDGEKLWCSEIQTESPKGVMIYLTGIKQPSITYFYGHASWMKKNGYASFLLEVRSHGKSTGDMIGLGYTEVEDVKTVVEYIKGCDAYKDLPIILQGVSMGGAITLNAFGQIPEIDACIAMSPYASFETQLDLLMAQYKVPKCIRTIELPMMYQTLKWLYGKEAVDNLAPEKQILNADGRPVLLIACLNDDSVPVQNTYILKKIYPNATMWVRDSWEHFIVKDCDFRDVEKDMEYCSYIMNWIEDMNVSDK